MLPPFEIAGGLPLALARGLSVAGLLSVFGTTLARVALLPPAPVPARIRPHWNRLLDAGLAAAAIGTAAWVWEVAASLSDAADNGAVAAALPVVLLHTQFGHAVLLRLALLAMAGIATARPRLAAALAAAAVLTQAAHSHAWAMDGLASPLLLADALHLLAAGAWLGGLLPLLLIVARGTTGEAARACRRFSRLGLACVLVLAGSATAQAWTLVGSLPGLVGTAYGWMVLVKLALLVVLLRLAAANRFRHTPALSGASADGARRRLLRSIGAETMLGLLVVLVAGVLTSLEPAMHLQPVWPFPIRPTLVAVEEDLEFRREVILAGLALGGAATLLLPAAMIRHRIRWLALAAGAAIAWFAAPHLDLLFVPAHPTSYQRSPTGFAAAAIARGAALYPQHCAACHGADGSGDGPAAAALPVRPADLTAAHLWMHGDGELFWWLSHGIEAPEGGQAMPGFAATLDPDALWDLIDFIRARNDGLVRARTGSWTPPLRAPAFTADCGQGPISLDALHGQVVRLVLGAASPAAVLTVAADPALPPRPNLCVTGDGSVARAYTLASGLSAAQARGAQFLIDARGWLRAVQPGGNRPSWNDPNVLAAAVASVRAHPQAGPERAATPMRMPM